MIQFTNREKKNDINSFVNSILEKSETKRFCERADVFFHILRYAFKETSIGPEDDNYTQNIVRELLICLYHCDNFKRNESIPWSTGRVALQFFGYNDGEYSIEFLIDVA